MSEDLVSRLREWNRQYSGKMPDDIVAAADIIESLRQQLAEVKEEKARGAAAALLTVQHDYQEIKSLKFQLVEREKHVTLLRDALKEIRDDFDCDSDSHRYGTTCRSCLAREALDATASKEQGK